MQCFIVPDSIVNQHQQSRNGDNVLEFIRDNQGRWIVNTGVAQLWPEIDFSTCQVAEISPEDFPGSAQPVPSMPSGEN